MKLSRLLYIGILAAALLTGCGDEENHSSQHHAPNGDLQELTASLTELPSFLDKTDSEIKEIYQIASQHLDLLQYIPCYCGCGESASHKHNGNCFVKEVKADGSVVWDDHGTRCGVCLEIAFIASSLQDEGKSVQEIRAFIDDKYKSGYAKPTPTPMPEA